MRISDWSSDVCSSDLGMRLPSGPRFVQYAAPASRPRRFLLRLPWLLVYCLRHRYDVYHLHDPDLVLPGFVLKWNGRGGSFDVHGFSPMFVLGRSWIPRPLRPLVVSLCRSLEMDE